MRKRVICVLLSLIICFSFGCGGGDNPPDDVEPNNEWPELEAANDSDFTHENLIWQDEFNGDELSEYWTHEIGNGSNGWGNSEKQYYRSENTRVNGGKLQIMARYETYQGFQYTSSRIKTADKFYFKYGKVEAKIKLPLGAGFWPAFWMMPQNSVYGGWPRSGEIDIMEAKGRLPYQTSCAVHYGMPWKYQGGTKYFFLNGPVTINDWHVYSLEWREKSIKMFVDGDMIYSNDGDWYTAPSATADRLYDGEPFDQEFYLILNLAVGGHFDNGIVPTKDMFGALMEVDYVRVFSLD